MDNQQSNTVMHVINGLAVGGVENLALQLLHHSPNHLEHVLVNLNPESVEMLPRFQAIPELKIINHSYQNTKKIQFILNLAKIIRTYQPKAILAYPFGLHVFVGLAARISSFPSPNVRATPQNSPPTDSAVRRQWKQIVVASRLLQIPLHCCSQAVEAEFQTFTKLPQGSFPIPNACNVEEIAQRAEKTRKQRVIPQEKIIIGMVARLNAIKDQETLIRAFDLVETTNPNLELWLIGEGNKRADLEELTTELELQDVVKFWGSRNDVPELLGKMDIYAFSTTPNEGFGIAVIEAMAANLPVVASDVPACREVLANGEAGLLVSPANPEALANTLHPLLRSQKQRNYWGEKAYAHSLSHYTSQACADQWYQILTGN
jgi:glycosyltransferase involved in cell wall biosynthesis